MTEETLLGEKVIWAGRPTSVETPGGMRALGLLLFALSAVSLCFATAISVTLRLTPTEPMLFAGWSAIFGVIVLQAPKIWLERVEYFVTERHVVMQRGMYRRTIERSAISFALIRWSARNPGTGDIDLVRAVPTGALRRRLLLQIRGVAAPDRVFAIIRGAQTSIDPHKGDRPLTQRLDDGEVVVWSAHPHPSLLSYLPRGRREIGVLVLSAILFVTFVVMMVRSIPNVRNLIGAGLPEVSLVAILAGEGIAAILVLGMALYFARESLVGPARKLRETRYLITNRRVLIQQGREELHLDREKIVDVIPKRSQGGLSDVFLVLDGPRARAVAMGGAFGEMQAGPDLKPVLLSVEDVDSLSRILLTPQGPVSRKAA